MIFFVLFTRRERMSVVMIGNIFRMSDVMIGNIFRMIVVIIVIVMLMIVSCFCCRIFFVLHLHLFVF